MNRRRRNTDGPAVINYNAVIASNDISGRNLVDQDNFYPADGVRDLGLDEYDYDLNDFEDTKPVTSTQLGLLDSDSIDEVYDTSLNDLGPGESFFDGDFSSADGAGARKKKASGRKQARGDRRAERTNRRDDRRNERKDKQSERQDKRESAQSERQRLRAERKTAKTDEISSRAEFNKALGSQPDGTAEILASMNTQTKSDMTPTTKKMSTGMIIGIAVASVTVLGVIAYFVVRKK
jgi:hypothetical protein